MSEDSGTAMIEGLGAAVGEMLGDFPADAPDTGFEVEAPAEGTPSPSESPETPAIPAAPAEGDDAPVEPQGTPPADAPVEAPLDEGTPVDAPDPETGFDADPALTYTVNGEVKTFDGIRLVDGAGYIKPSAVADVQRRLGERDHLVAANQQLYQTTKQYDAALVYKSGSAGKEQEYRGVNAFRQAALDAASGTAAGIYMIEQFSKLFPNPTPEQASGLKEVFDRAQLIMENTALKTASQFGADVQTRYTQAEVPTYEKRYADSFEQIQTWAKANNHTLTPDDLAEARDVFGGNALMRAARTPEEVRQFGNTMFDPAPLNRWVERRVAQNQKAAQAASVAKTATQTNQNRIANAVRPTQKPVAQQTRTPERPVNQKAQDASDAWDLRENLAAAAMRGGR